MVLVSVCNQESLDAVDIFDNIRVIRDNVVDTKKIILGEFNPCINDDNFVLVDVYKRQSRTLLERWSDPISLYST